MPKLISLVQPYEIKNIKNFHQFLVFAKNLIRIICTKGCQEKVDGVLVPVRWSKEKKVWVVDRGTNLFRDKVGVDLSNIKTYYRENSVMYNAVSFILNAVNSLQNINVIGKDYGLLKNSSKFIAFEYVNHKTNIVDYEKEYAYILGLYQRHNKNRDVFYNKKKTQSTLLSQDKDFKEKFVNENINTPDFFKLNANYRQVYLEFTSEILEKYFNKEKISFYYKENYALESVSSLKKIKKAYSSQKDVLCDKKLNSQMLNVYLSVFLGDFLKRKLSISNQEGVVIYDSVLKSNVKIVGKSILQEKKQFKNNLSNNENDYSSFYMIPKAF